MTNDLTAYSNDLTDNWLRTTDSGSRSSFNPIIDRQLGLLSVTMKQSHVYSMTTDVKTDKVCMKTSVSVLCEGLTGVEQRVRVTLHSPADDRVLGVRDFYFRDCGRRVKIFFGVLPEELTDGQISVRVTVDVTEKVQVPVEKQVKKKPTLFGFLKRSKPETVTVHQSQIHTLAQDEFTLTGRLTKEYQTDGQSAA